MHVATLPIFGKTILTTPVMDMANPNHKFPDNTFRTRDITVATFDAAAADARAALTPTSPPPGRSPSAITSSPTPPARSAIASSSSTTCSTTAPSSPSICD